MKILHQVGHNKNWNLDAHFENDIGDGFIFCSYSLESEKVAQKYGIYKPEDYLDNSFFDSQFYGNKKSQGGKFETYDFHPALQKTPDSTDEDEINSIFEAINFQIRKGFKKIIIPFFAIDNKNFDNYKPLIEDVNNKLANSKKQGYEYFFTVAFDKGLIQDKEAIEKLLLVLTDNKITFDGYYIVCSTEIAYKKKISEDYDYYFNLSNVLKIIKQSDLKIILGFANWDSIIFSSVVDLDYVTIGSFENLRNFRLERFTEEASGGPSKGWYYSRVLLNVIKAESIKLFRIKKCLDEIKNIDNIFSDIILQEGYLWDNVKPDIHKNYMLAICQTLTELNKIKDIEERIKAALQMISKAKKVYESLNQQGIKLSYAESGDHLDIWESFLTAKYQSLIQK